MANHLDLEEQEQLDQLKAFWKQYGNLISWVLIAALGAFAGWNLYQRWQIGQASQAAAMYDELERVIKVGDISKLDRAIADMRDKFPSTTYASQASLLAAKVYFEAGKTAEAKSSLLWVADKSPDNGYQSVAKLRLAGLLMDAKSYDDALLQLAGTFPTGFLALVADRRGDIFSLQGKKAEARGQYELAFKSFEEPAEYRRLVEVKLNALGVDPRPAPRVATGTTPAEAADTESKK